MNVVFFIGERQGLLFGTSRPVLPGMMPVEPGNALLIQAAESQLAYESCAMYP